MEDDEKSGKCPLFIDTHAHLDDPRFNKDREDVIKRAIEAGIEHIITVGCWEPEKGLDTAVRIAESYDNIYTAIGAHPHDARVASNDTFQQIEALTEHKKVIAIGETGLDFHYDKSPRNIQMDVFRRHIQIARRSNLPLIIHTREAEGDTLDILKEEGGEEIGGVFHCFSGDHEMARECIKMGFFLSFTGIVTFTNATNIHEIIKKVPVERILLETDCPYLSPEPHRGKRNEPAFLVETAKKIAEIKALSLEDIARITTLNAKELFGIGKLERPSKIAYKIRDSLYLNVTNRCTNYCTFCAKHRSFSVKGHYLRLRYEPTFEDIIKAVGPDPQNYKEVVFCGFGEPLIRIDLVKKSGLFLKKMGCRIRIDTDGLANIVHGKNVLPELMFVDEISVSLNAPDSESYQSLVKTPYGDDAFPAILWFLKEAKKYIKKVNATVVAVPGLDVESCRRLAEDEIGVAFRVREYNEVG
ncbi:MAG: TatD family hydrolase [Thermodesulfobacteriota bacterium]